MSQDIPEKKFLKGGRRRFLKVTLFILALVILYEVYYLGTSANSIPPSKAQSPANPFPNLQLSEYNKEEEFWSQRIDKVGATQAYDEFKEEYKDLNFGKQHALSHLFGVLLYNKNGPSGVAVCDSTFAFGCYHSFFGKAISLNGVAIVQELDKACVAKWGVKGLGCPHGIGHGLLSYFGEENLLDALEVCSTLSWKEPIGGCTSGVFMEYNFRTMADPSNLKMREVGDNVHYPCDIVPEKFLQACYFEQPQWWEKVLAENYDLIGRLCEEIVDRPASEACFRGTGNTIGPSTQYDVRETIARCGRMPSRDSEILCRQGASWSFYAEPSKRELASEVCRGLGAETEVICDKGADLFRDKL